MPVFLEERLSAAYPTIHGSVLVLTFSPIFRRLPSVLVMYDMVVDGQLDRKGEDVVNGPKSKTRCGVEAKEPHRDAGPGAMHVPHSEPKAPEPITELESRLWRPRS